MSAVDGNEPKHEILIIRRGGHDDHDDHHGGVWKIAFADFMTAMMCFFLVMWLINAANEQTKAAVASYFNPIKLTDRNASRKGLEDVGEGPSAPEDERENVTEPSPAAATDGARVTGPVLRNEARRQADDQRHSDEHLFSNPFAVLAEIASETGSLQNISDKGDGGAQLSGPATGASGGESFRDPFAPDFWSQNVMPEFETAPPDDAARPEALGETPVPPPPRPQEAAADPTPRQEAAAAPLAATPAASLREAEEILQQIRESLPAGDAMRERIGVEVTPRGIMISITDELEFGMFEIGSAVPKREMVLAMEKIGRVLSAHSGKVAIVGHTDARPFAGKDYDNWRLSTSRAHSAYYMLLRAGLDERRVSEVTGHADRKPKIASDPMAAANRRIEILLEPAA